MTKSKIHTSQFSFIIFHLSFCCVAALLAFTIACQHPAPNTQDPTPSLIIEDVGYPQAILYDSLYYFTIQSMGGDSVELYCTPDLTQLAQAQRRTVWSAQRDTMTHFWSPEIYRINDKWYIYFEGDDGNTDNHHLFVMECEDNDPMTGQFVMKGPIETHAEWNYGIHPNILQLPNTPLELRSLATSGTQEHLTPNTQLYLLWSGWPKRRAETETQCIYIAQMENPWTLSSERIMISKPEYEWERQWINPDGNRSAYPIYVNENPEAFLTPDQQHVIVLYSASGIWTVYTALGMLTAPATANLLDPESWTKNPEPLLMPDVEAQTSISNVYLIPSTDGQSTQMLYEFKRMEQGNIVRDTYLRPVTWTDDGQLQLDPQ